ncbi:MAG: PAS domain S-box protein [Verrucomicrobiota bacterium]|nr:PAS domain S-box protein [Verrucomicrobiota bacterium]
MFSPRHFHYKLLSGAAAGVLVIIFLASIFLWVTFRNRHQDSARTHTIHVMRLASVVENDIAMLETYQRAFLLTGDAQYRDPFEKRAEAMRQRMAELNRIIVGSTTQRQRIAQARDVVVRWVTDVGLPSFKAKPADPITTSALGSPLLDQAREILQSLQDEEQIVLNKRMREQEWASQSTQILDFLPKLERAVIEMDKEKRGYLLTGENSCIEAYRRSLEDFYTYHGYLTILAATSPSQAELLADVRANVERWITSSAVPEMDAKRNGHDISTTASTAKSDQLVREVQQTILEFQNNELAVYDSRSAAVSRQSILKTLGLSMLSLLAVGLLVSSNSYSFVLVRRQVAKLEGAETRIRAIIESILDGMITVDEDGTIASMNPAAEKIFGCINNEMIGHKFTKLVPKAYFGGIESQARPIAWEELAQRTGTTALAVGRTRKHATFPIEISLSEMIINGTKFYTAMIRDVTERKRFEQEIASEKESLAVTLRSIGDGVITTDVAGKVIMINNAAEALTGWKSQDAVGQPLKSVFNISIDLAAQARAQRSGYRNEAHSILLSLPENATLVDRDNGERLIEQVASPIRDNKNEVAGVVLVFRDITERHRNESERRKAEALEQLGLLAGGIAHDFNNLLTAIIGNISLASLFLPTTDEMATRLNDAKNASMRARDLAQQLLTFARGGAPIKKTASIGKLIQDTVSFSLRGSHSRSEFTFGSDLRPAEIDPGQISQVVANLVVNADQAMPNGGTLRVNCENYSHHSTSPLIPDLMPGEYVRIAIKDEGMGIPDQYLKRIFDPYFTTKAKGNGLGLATTYSIIKNHNGLITVESEMHVGSTFTIYLPASQPAEVAEEKPRASLASINGTGRVLIVDDEEAIRALVEFTLSHLGYEVSTAESALAGVELYKEHLDKNERFDVVILDLTLPGGMGGKEALKRLIEIDPTVNAIVSSGYAMDATMSRYEDFGFRGVIAKPYEAAELGRIVHDVIASSHIDVKPDYEMRAIA